MAKAKRDVYKRQGLPFAGTMVMAMLFAIGSLILILSLAYSADRGMSTQTIILMGVVFSMFATSIISLLTAFSGEKLRSITFWTMGSVSYTHLDVYKRQTLNHLKGVYDALGNT